MGIGSIGEKTFVFNFVYSIGAVGENLFFDTFEIVSDNYGFKFYSEAVGEYTSFSEKLEAHIGNTAFVVFAVDYEVVLV